MGSYDGNFPFYHYYKRISCFIFRVFFLIFLHLGFNRQYFSFLVGIIHVVPSVYECFYDGKALLLPCLMVLVITLFVFRKFSRNLERGL